MELNNKAAREMNTGTGLPLWGNWVACQGAQAAEASCTDLSLPGAALKNFH